MQDTDKYLKIVEWSDEDQCYIGSAPPLIGQCCHGNDETKVYKQLCKIVAEWVMIHKEKDIQLPEGMADKEYSGKFVVRVGEDIHKMLAIKASMAGTSLNNFCKEILLNSPNLKSH